MKVLRCSTLEPVSKAPNRCCSERSRSTILSKNLFFRSFLMMLFICVVSVFALAQSGPTAVPTANNFAYPQSLFVDSRNGHVWVTDFDHHRVLRFDISSLTAVEIERKDRIPGTMTLSQNYPNPFNPVTQIAFSLAAAGRATLRVTNTLGQTIAILFDEEVTPGTVYSVPFYARNITSGIYLYSLRSSYGVIVKKMCIVK
jgi:hypothetical protein